MRYFKALEVSSVPAGVVLLLTDNQARRRKNKIEPLAQDNQFSTKSPCQFKVGEVIGVDSDLGILNLMTMVEVDKDGKPLADDTAEKPDRHDKARAKAAKADKAAKAKAPKAPKAPKAKAAPKAPAPVAPPPSPASVAAPPPPALKET